MLVHNTRKTTRKETKLDPNWTGPFKIKAVHTKGTYSLDEMKCIVNGNRLKLYRKNNQTASSKLISSIKVAHMVTKSLTKTGGRSGRATG